MKRLTENGELVSDFWQLKPLKVRKIKNEAAAIRADWIDKTCKLLNRPYPMIAAKLYGYPTEWVKEMYETANSFVKNPSALWWRRYNDSRK